MNKSPRPSLATRMAFPLCLLFFAAAIFWKAILTNEYTILSYPDSSWQSYPWFQYIAQTLHRGRFPFWDPFTFGGRSFVGEAQTGVFYPLNLILGMIPLDSRGLLPVSAIEGFVVFHCFLASLFAYLLARQVGLARFNAFVCGIVFAYSGSIGVRAFGQINILYSAAWLPMVFLCYLKSLAAVTWRRRLFFANLSGLAFSLCLLGGHHQPFVYCGLAVAFTALLLWYPPQNRYRNVSRPTPIRRLVPAITLCVYVFAFAYSSIQLLPSIEYSSRAYRWIGADNPVIANGRVPYSIGGTLGKLPPQGVMELVFPYVAGVENTPYFGILPLFFVFLSLFQIRKSKLVRICWLLALLFLTLALGDATPLHGIFYFLVPGFNQTRATSRILLIVHLAVSLLAGIGCSVFLSPAQKKERVWRMRAIGVFGAFALALAFLLVTAYLYRSRDANSSTDYESLFFAWFLVLASAGLALARAAGLVHLRTARLVVLAVCLFDFHHLLSVHIKTKDGFDRKANYEPGQYYREDKVLQFLRSQPGTFRVDFRGEYYPPNIGEVYRLETLSGHGATAPKPFFDLIVAGGFKVGRVSDLYNVKYIVSTEDLSFPKLFQQNTTKVYENRSCMPRAWLVGTVIAKKTPEQVLTALMDPPFDPRQAALVEGESVRFSPAAGTETRSDFAQPSFAAVQFEARGPNRFILTTETPVPAFLVISENWDPGWKAAVNGTPSPIQRTDGPLMGIQLRPGRSRVDLRYYPKNMPWGFGLAGLAAIVLVYAALGKASGAATE